MLKIWSAVKRFWIGARMHTRQQGIGGSLLGFLRQWLFGCFWPWQLCCCHFTCNFLGWREKKKKRKERKRKKISVIITDKWKKEAHSCQTKSTYSNPAEFQFRKAEEKRDTASLLSIYTHKVDIGSRNKRKVERWLLSFATPELSQSPIGNLHLLEP